MGINITRRTVAKLILLAVSGFSLGFAYNYHLPRIEAYLLGEVERVSQERSPIRIWAQRLHFHLVPLGVSLEEVRLLAQAPLDKYLAPATLHEVGAHLALLPLLRGELRLSQVYIRNSELNLFLRSDLFTDKKGPEKLRLDFDQLYQLPIDEFLLEDVQIQGRLEPQNVVFRVTNLNVTIENRYRSIFVEVNAPRVMVKPSGPVHPLNAQLELRTLIEASEMQVSAFKLKAGDSFVVASGKFNGDLAVGRFDTGMFEARSRLDLEDINAWENIFYLKPRIPRLEGRAEMDLGIELQKKKGYKFDVDVKTTGVEIDKYTVGQIQGHLTSNLKSISSDVMHLSNNSGKVDLIKLTINLEPKTTISAVVKVPGIEVHELLENLDVKHVPIMVPIKGEAECLAVLGDSPEVNCSGGFSAAKIHVDTGRPKFSTIVEAVDVRAKGQVKVTAKDVSYKGDLALGRNSAGHSDGVINYDKGFKINYQADNLDFAEVKNLVNLKFEGAMKINGSTTGTSHWATIDMSIDGKDLWLEDYPLGSATSKVNYKAGHLNFSALQGQFEVTRYTGQVDLDLDKDRIRMSGQIPFMDLKDVQSLFKRKVTLPIAMSGTGTGRLEAEGPLRFRDMSYDFRSSFFRGQMAGESFDEFVFQVKAKDGLVKSEKITLSKSSGVVDVKGQITPKGEMDCVAVGRSMRLEQSENILSMGLDLQGLADFTVLVRGQLPHPRVELNGRLSKVVLGDIAAEDSVFKLNFLDDRMEGSGQFLGTTLVSDFTFPYTSEAPFRFKLKTKKWDFITLFSLLSRSARQIDFNTSVTMDVNLSADHGGLWASSGRVDLSEFVIRKGSKSMAAEKPMIFIVKQGVVNSDNSVISAGDSYLKLDVAGLTKNALNASLNGKVDLSLLGLFTPFISDLRGNMAVSMDLKGTAEKPFVSGSAYIDRGYAKFSDFYHPVSNVRADILFNDNQILLNTIRGDIAGGKLSGDGKITFSGKSRPIDIKGSFSDVKLNIPDGFHTQGSGTVAIRGDAFPYVMDLTYDVSGGEVVSEFGENSSGNSSVKASAFLPHFLDRETFHPFDFLLDIGLKNPILVNNSLVQASWTGHIRANGTPDHLLLNGSLTPVPGGKVFFNDVAFDIGSAYVEYSGNPPGDPKIYLTGTAHVIENVVDDKGASANQYDVSLLVQGHAQDPQLNLTSQPPLAQREIVSLLALGVTGAVSEERKTGENQTANTSAALGAAILKKAGGKRVKESFGVDVKLSSSQSTVDTAASPKVTLSKQWTPKFGASASSTLESNPNNNVKLEYKMNKSVSVIGSWDGRETLHDQQKDTTKNILGLDLQYKVPFK